MKPAPIIVPDNKGALHIYCLTQLFCRHSLGGLNPTLLPHCGKQNTSKRYRRKTVLKIFRTGDVENILPPITLLISNPWSSTAKLSSSSRSQVTPCSVYTTLNCLLGKVLFVCWGVVINALLTLVPVTVFIVWLYKVSARFIKWVTTSSLELLRADLIIVLAGFCYKEASLFKLIPKRTCVLVNLFSSLLQEVGD